MTKPEQEGWKCSSPKCSNMTTFAYCNDCDVFGNKGIQSTPHWSLKLNNICVSLNLSGKESAELEKSLEELITQTLSTTRNEVIEEVKGIIENMIAEPTDLNDVIIYNTALKDVLTKLK